LFDVIVFFFFIIFFDFFVSIIIIFVFFVIFAAVRVRFVSLLVPRWRWRRLLRRSEAGTDGAAPSPFFFFFRVVATAIRTVLLLAARAPCSSLLFAAAVPPIFHASFLSSLFLVFLEGELPDLRGRREGQGSRTAAGAEGREEGEQKDSGAAPRQLQPATTAERKNENENAAAAGAEDEGKRRTGFDACREMCVLVVLSIPVTTMT
jgi:hypothetical protein